MRRRVEFRLSMPGVGSWNGKWTGESNNYTIVRSLSDKKIEELGISDGGMDWSYSFGDGWRASVGARIMAVGEKAKKSDGFCGYDWMVDSIVDNNAIVI